MSARTRCLLLWVTVGLGAWGQTPPVPGLGVGSKIPEIAAQDQNGVQQSFSSIRGAKGAILVFYRSADW